MRFSHFLAILLVSSMLVSCCSSQPYQGYRTYRSPLRDGTFDHASMFRFSDSPLMAAPAVDNKSFQGLDKVSETTRTVRSSTAPRRRCMFLTVVCTIWRQQGLRPASAESKRSTSSFDASEIFDY
ncbi:unnamed protein product [Caenorhabditis brenneri]